MPVIAVNLSQKTYADIMGLVTNGAYSGPEQFLEIAAFNQLALERGLTPEDLVKGLFRPANAVAHSQTGLLSDRPAAPRTRRAAKQAAEPAENSTATIAVVRRASVEVTNEEISAALSHFSRPGDTSALLPCDPVTTAGTNHIWGQVNRLFPLKAACRWIINAAVAKGQWPTPHVVLDHLAPDAAILGSLLERRDAEAGRKRGEMLGTGLPRKGNLQSSDRYLTQSIARVTRSNAMYPGAISDYGLACVTRERVMLTAPGVDLAILENPILDSDSAATTLSEDERSLLLCHILNNVTSERNDFQTVLQAINAGSSSPVQLMTAARSQFPSEWTDVVYRTHIYGILARLSELGAIRKQRQGRMVEYQVAESGRRIVAA